MCLQKNFIPRWIPGELGWQCLNYKILICMMAFYLRLSPLLLVLCISDNFFRKKKIRKTNKKKKPHLPSCHRLQPWCKSFRDWHVSSPRSPHHCLSSFPSPDFRAAPRIIISVTSVADSPFIYYSLYFSPYSSLRGRGKWHIQVRWRKVFQQWIIRDCNGGGGGR